MAQWVQGIAAKADGPEFNLRAHWAHTVERENRLLSVASDVHTCAIVPSPSPFPTHSFSLKNPANELEENCDPGNMTRISRNRSQHGGGLEGGRKGLSRRKSRSSGRDSTSGTTRHPRRRQHPEDKIYEGAEEGSARKSSRKDWKHQRRNLLLL